MAAQYPPTMPPKRGNWWLVAVPADILIKRANKHLNEVTPQEEGFKSRAAFDLAFANFEVEADKVLVATDPNLAPAHSHLINARVAKLNNFRKKVEEVKAYVREAATDEMFIWESRGFMINFTKVVKDMLAKP